MFEAASVPHCLSSTPSLGLLFEGPEPMFVSSPSCIAVGNGVGLGVFASDGIIRSCQSSGIDIDQETPKTPQARFSTVHL